MTHARNSHAMLAASLLILGSIAYAKFDGNKPGVAPDAALKVIKTGNTRFVTGFPERPNQTPDHRAKVAQKQTPHTVVVTCSDSRLSPELIFDQGIGDLFVVRTAGNTVDAENLGSVEYATAVLGARLVVVLGHNKCGAVDAAMKGGKLPGNIPAVVKPIQNALPKTKCSLDEAIAINVKAVEATLAKKNKLTADMVKRGQIQVKGAVYDLASGKVRFID
ncbi:MAG: carbonic anhydrase [Fimbriimonas sp.]